MPFIEHSSSIFLLNKVPDEYSLFSTGLYFSDIKSIRDFFSLSILRGKNIKKINSLPFLLATFSPLGLSTAAGQTMQGVDSHEIIVSGQRNGSDVAALRHFDADDIRAMGITNISELISRLGAQVKGADGADPVFAINGRRPMNNEEVETLPMDAVQSFDLLPPEASTRLGYPPNQPVMNLTTKKHFRGVDVQLRGQTTTDGGGSSATGKSTVTRITGKRRWTLAGNVSFQQELRQSRRDIKPDTDTYFDGIGNISGSNGGEIDPLLSSLAGYEVVVAAVPIGLPQRRELAAYQATANQSRSMDVGPFRSLQPRQRSLKLSTFISQPITDDITASLSLSIERDTAVSLQGLAAASLSIPSDNPFSPFSTDVVVNRYLTEASALRQRGEKFATHAGAGFVGAIEDWSWQLRLNYDRKTAKTDSDLGFDTSKVQRAIETGSDALAEYPVGLLGARLTDFSRSTIIAKDAQLILNGVLVMAPAGPIALTANLNAERSSTRTTSSQFPQNDAFIHRSRGGGVLAASIPLVSSATKPFAFLGRLTAEMSVGVEGVSRYGALNNSHASLIWTPIKGIQFLTTVRKKETAPPLSDIGSPSIAVPNMPFVDLVSGDSVFVTAISGGNAMLNPERRKTISLSSNLKPFINNAFNIFINYELISIRDQTSTISTVTPIIEDAFPDRFARDSQGQLEIVDLRSLNFFREELRSLKGTFSYSGPVGTKAVAISEDSRPLVDISLTTSLRLEDSLQLRSGGAVLDLLDGDNISATGGRPKWEVQTNFSIYQKPTSITVQTIWRSGTRSRSEIPESDLRFGSLETTNLFINVDLQSIVKNKSWSKNLMLDFGIQNITNARQSVFDRFGDTPRNLQPSYLDALGRIVSFKIFKRF